MGNDVMVKEYRADTSEGGAWILISKHEDNTYRSTAFILSKNDCHKHFHNEPSEKSAYEKAERWIKEIDNTAVFHLMREA